MVNNIQSIMKNLKLTVGQAMDALSIPQSQSSIYVGLVYRFLITSILVSKKTISNHK